ncbi:T9SS type A sorting domain-containing protein [Hymenobacter antarcticus]|uniref:T9SS type A sorting domain-containing protein n=1 Tax=Hymenobacter antarcticus TaxID=486270 RepID=UPI0031E6C274
MSLLLLLLGPGVLSTAAQTPTAGLIFKPATAGTPGAAVLDPNGDGYVSAAATGFAPAGGDLGTQSEIPYKYLPQRTSLEPNADLRVGPSNKFTDFADVTGGGSSVGFFVDGNGNYMFRFRLGSSAPNSKGYSIAIDTDNKFGFTGPNADPNAVAHNPGFEMEILLASNFGVRLYNIDGTANPSDPGLDNVGGPDGSMIELPYVSYAQKALAVTTNGGDPDVFYDFYIPLSVIQAQFGDRTFFNSTGTTAVPFTLNTALRLVANTIIAPHSVTHYQNISDIGGVNDAAYPNPDYAYIDLVTGSTATTGATVPTTLGNAIPARSAAPVVSSPLLTGATSVSGTSAEAAGTVITVFVNGTALGTTTTVQSGGTWTLAGIAALASGALVKATATAAGKSQSDFSNEVQAAGSTACATAVPAMPTCIDLNGRGFTGTTTANHRVYVRTPDGALMTGLAANPVLTDATGAYAFSSQGGNSTCTTGQTNTFKGTYFLSQAPPAASGGCESAGLQLCINAAVNAAPVVTTARPITASTASLGGTATAGGTVLLYVDGQRYSAVTATGGNFTFSTATATLPALATGRTLTLYAYVSGNSGTCLSSGVALNVVAARTVAPPEVSDPLMVGGTVVSGTSGEAVGAAITLSTYTLVNGVPTSTVTYSTTVLAGGAWSVTVPALTAGLNASATVTPANYGTSAVSNVVVVQSQTASVPVISGTYAEKGTSITGTSAAPTGSLITVYEDGDVLGTTTVAAGGTWTLAGLSNGSGLSPNTAYPALYAGGVLTATATETGKLASAASAPVPVGCATIADKSFSTGAICQNQVASFTVTNVEPGVVYSLQDATSGSSVATGYSRVGTGAGTSSLTLSTAPFATAGTYSIKLNAYSVGAVNCSQTTAAVPLTVNPLPIDKALGAQASAVSAGNSGTTITVATSEVGVSYQLVDTGNNSSVGGPQAGTGNTLGLPTGPIAATTTYAVSAVTTNSCARQLSQTRTITYSTVPLPVELTAFEAEARGEDAALVWRTASERNNDHFEVERSLDGRGFTPVERIPGAGNSSQPLAYAWTDARSGRLAEVVYYRLRQVDGGGTAAYSPVRAVKFGPLARPARLVLYPNPAASKVTLDLSLVPAGTYAIQILNATGQTVRTERLRAGQVHELDVTALAAGLYEVHVQGAGLSLNSRLVKLL